MSPDFPEPGSSSDVRESFLRYLDFFRESVVDKVSGLSEDDLRSSRLPSGWTPIELVKHLSFMERRWLVWGFLAEQVDEPWGDQLDGRWHVGPDESTDELVEALRQAGRRTRGIVEAAELSAVSVAGGRFAADDGLPTLAAILFHVLQEYARHVGHLDVARELVDGTVGE